MSEKTETQMILELMKTNRLLMQKIKKMENQMEELSCSMCNMYQMVDCMHDNYHQLDDRLDIIAECLFGDDETTSECPQCAEG